MARIVCFRQMIGITNPDLQFILKCLWKTHQLKIHICETRI